MIELNKIYNEDCLVGMKRIPGESVDCIICDLPYGTTKNAWDSVIPLNDLWTHYNRIIKENGAIILFSQMPFTAVLACSNLNDFKYEIVWQKENATGFLNSNFAPMKIHENIVTFDPHFIPWWDEVRYSAIWHGQRFKVILNDENIKVTANDKNTMTLPISICGKNHDIKPGRNVTEAIIHK